MSSRKRKLSPKLFDSKVCAFCGSSDDNVVLFGKLIVSNDTRAHENCLFFASGLIQNGKPSGKFLGFLLRDIAEELRRGKRLNCCYCRKRGATVGCSISACKKTFHLNCGIDHGSLHQFFDSYLSFCKDHKPKQDVVEIKDSSLCNICFEDILPNQLESCLYSPCCKNGWFHKICLQKYASSAGYYFFKCPLCNDSKAFIPEMKKYGICVPEKDASWELEGNAFEDLSRKPQCDGPTCLCAKGRAYCSTKKSGWTLVPCADCGSHARHKNCENIPISSDFWMCDECKAMEENITKNKTYAEIPAENVATSGTFDGQDSMFISSASSSTTITSIPSLLPLQDGVNPLPCSHTPHKNYEDIPLSSDSLVCNEYKAMEEKIIHKTSEIPAAYVAISGISDVKDSMSVSSASSPSSISSMPSLLPFQDYVNPLPCSHAHHKNCENIPTSSDSSVCNECRVMEEKIIHKTSEIPAAYVAISEISDVKDSMSVSSASSPSSISSMPSLLPYQDYVNPLPCSHAHHKNCENIPTSSDSSVCNECRAMEEKTINKTSEIPGVNLAISGISDVKDSMSVSSASSPSSISSMPSLLPFQDYVNPLPCSHAHHKNCENIPISSDSSVCNECRAMEEKIIKGKTSEIPAENVATSGISEVQDSIFVSSAPSSSIISSIPTLLPLQDCVNKERVNSAHSDVAAASSTPEIASPEVGFMGNASKIEMKEFTSDCFENKCLEIAQNKSELLADPNTFKSGVIAENEKVNFQKLKLLALSFSNKKLRKTSKTNVSRRAVKRQKIDHNCCGSNHHCIKRYFGHECGKYRV